MSEYAPETTTVRNAYVKHMRNAFVASTSELRDEFDRWLKQVQADAWDVGYQRGLRDEMSDVTHGADNPYREDDPTDDCD